MLSDELHKIKMAFLTADANVQSHIHAGLRCAPETKTYKRWYEKELSRLQDIRDLAKIEWDKVKPDVSRRERLIAAANGHEDLPSTHAARRLLAKRNICWK